MLVIAQACNLNLREVLSCEVSPIPWSLASADGTMCKTMKSTLHSLLEKNVKPLSSLPKVICCIVDAMALLQSMTQIPVTVNKLAEKVLIMVKSSHESAIRIDVVGDQYPMLSIKGLE